MNWKLYFVIMILQIISAFAMFSYIPLIVPISEELHLSSKQIGFIATAGALGGICFGILSGWLVDRIKTRYIMLLGPGLLAISLLVFSLSNSYFLIVLANLLLGIGYTIVNPLTNRLIVYYFPSNKLGTLLSFKQSGSTIGQAMGGFLLPLLIVTLTWRSTLGLITFLLVIVVVYCFFYFFSMDTFDEIDKSVNKQGISNKQGKINGQKGKEKFPKEAFFLLIMGFSMLGYQASFAAFLIPYLTDEKEISYAVAGAFLGVSQLVGAFSRPLLGWLSDSIFHGSRKKVLVICGIGNVLFTIALVYLPESFMILTVFLLVLLGITCFGWAGIYFAYVVEIFGKKRSGLATGYAVMANSLGAAIFPLLFGAALDLTSYQFSFTANSLFILAITVLISYKLSEVNVKQKSTNEAIG